MDSFLSCMCIVCIASDAKYNNNYKYNNKNKYKYKSNINNRNMLNDFLRKFSENSHSFPIK